jgi:TolB-like protein
MNGSLKLLVALAPLAAAAPVVAQSSAPVVAVLAFDNAAFGPAAKEYDGIGKGIMDLVITDLASGSKVRVVDRARVQNLLDEQNLTKSGAIDGQTAVRVGKLFGACYSVYGSFIRNDKTGENVLTIHTTSNETGQIQNARKITSKGDDVMELVTRASAEFASSVDVKACAGTAGTSRSSTDAAPAQQQGGKATAAVIEYAKPLTDVERKKLQGTKLDARTMLLYSRALDARDHKEIARAKSLAEQVIQKNPDFGPARQLIVALNSGN